MIFGSGVSKKIQKDQKHLFVVDFSRPDKELFAPHRASFILQVS